MTTPVTSLETFPSSEVSSFANDLMFRMTQHAEMTRESRFGIVHTKMPNRMRAIREERELTQDQVAESLHTSKTRVTRKENGKEPFNNFYLEAFARAVDLEPMLLIAPDDVVELLEAWTKCASDERAHFLKHIKQSASGTPPEEPPPAAPPAMPQSRLAKQHMARGRSRTR